MDSCFSDSVNMANIFNEFFSSGFIRDNGVLPSSVFTVPAGCNISSTNFCALNVQRMRRLKPTTSSGPESIPNVVYIKLASVLNPPLASIFEIFFRLCALSNIWRLGHITPIFKKGGKRFVNNYRPVSVTCVACRIMERVILQSLHNYLHNNLLSIFQHGFLSKRSTASSLLFSSSDWISSLDNKLCTDVIFVDFAKAFDAVSHEKLLYKLSNFEVKGCIFDWIRAFLSNRKQCAKISGVFFRSCPCSQQCSAGLRFRTFLVCAFY